MATLLVRADVASIEAVDQSIDAVARRLDESAGETTDERRVTALLMLARGRDGLDDRGEPTGVDAGDLLPRVTLFATAIPVLTPRASPGSGPSAAEARPSPRPGWPGCWGHAPASRSGRSSIWPVRLRSTPTRSRTDIDRPCA
jgi:hypothetical protein